MEKMVTLPTDFIPSFYRGLYNVVDDPSLDSVVSWSTNNRSFIVWNPREFQRIVLSRSGMILCPTLTLFTSNLKHYGFVIIKGDTGRHLQIGHPKYFVRGKPELMKKMHQEVHERQWRRSREKVARKLKAAEESKARSMELADGLRDLGI